MAHRLIGRARRDVLDIWRRIAADSESSADRFIDRLTQLPAIGKSAFCRDVSVMTYIPAIGASPLGEYLIF